MYRISLIAFVPFFLSAVLVAQEPAAEPLPAEPPSDLENIAVYVMYSAFQANDFETVETLFDKLSLENKKKFLLGASPAAQDKHATQLLARLTLSLFEETVKTPHALVMHEMEYQTPLPAPTGALPSPYMVHGHDDGYITLNSYGRVYIKGLNASEIVDAVNFHLSRHIPNEKTAKDKPYFKSYYVRDIVGEITPLPEDNGMMGGMSGGLGNMNGNMNFGSIFQIIQTVIEPESWQSFGGDGVGELAIHWATKSLAIRQTERIHAQIENLLDQIRKLNANVASANQTPVR